MRNILLGAAAAAMLCGPASAQETIWSGGYVSVTGGYGFQPQDGAERFGFDKNLDADFGDTINTAAGANAFSPGFCGGAAASALPGGGCAADEDGGAFGGRLGYDWQSGRLVLGVLGEGSSADVTDSVSAFSTTPAFYTFTRKVDWTAALRARVGVARGAALVYATGGGVRAGIDNTFTTSNRVNTFVPAAADSAWGYQAGGGLEYRFSRLSVGAEYLYTRLQDDEDFTVRVQGPAPATNPFVLTNASGTDLRRTERFSFSTARLVVGYRF
jgi:outer membrane immunogenic protein